MPDNFRLPLKLFALVAVLCCFCQQASATWRCRECIQSVTIHVQLERERYSGTDNEGPPHFVDFTYLCTPKPNAGVAKNESLTRIGAQVPSARAVNDTNLVDVAPPGPPGVVYVGYRSVSHKALMGGWIERGTTSTYTYDLPPEAVAECGGCIMPVELGSAFAVAGNRDGMQMKTMTIVANLQDHAKSSVLLMLDRSFTNGWLDTNDYPYPANRKVKLTKGGC